MKQYTSRLLKTVALGYMAFPVVYLVLAALLFDIPAKLCLRIILSPLYYLLCFWAVCAGYGLWEMRRWAWHVFLFSNLLIIYGNAVLASDYGTSHHKILAFIFSLLLMAVMIVRLGREIRVPYFLPRIRWWESNPRYRLTVPVTIVREGGARLSGDILDLSMGGSFIKVRLELSQDEPLTLEFKVFNAPFKFNGIVVWRTHSTVTHPKGIGVKFGPLPRDERRLLRAVIHRLKKIANLYNSARYLMSPEELGQRIEELKSSRLDVARVEEEEAADEL